MKKNILQIKGYEHYYIDKKGIVYSNAPSSRFSFSKKMRILAQAPHPIKGHVVVRLHKDKKRKAFYVHRLVLETFVGSCPEGMQCRHLNGNSQDNRLENLKWGTPSENQADRLTHGTDNRGVKHGMSKLTPELVLKIREMATRANKNTRSIDKGGNYKEIAKHFNISRTTVGSIVSGRTWSWLK